MSTENPRATQPGANAEASAQSATTHTEADAIETQNRNEAEMTDERRTEGATMSENPTHKANADFTRPQSELPGVPAINGMREELPERAPGGCPDAPPPDAAATKISEITPNDVEGAAMNDETKPSEPNSYPAQPAGAAEVPPAGAVEDGGLAVAGAQDSEGMPWQGAPTGRVSEEASVAPLQVLRDELRGRADGDAACAGTGEILVAGNDNVSASGEGSPQHGQVGSVANRESDSVGVDASNSVSVVLGNFLEGGSREETVEDANAAGPLEGHDAVGLVDAVRGEQRGELVSPERFIETGEGSEHGDGDNNVGVDQNPHALDLLAAAEPFDHVDDVLLGLETGLGGGALESGDELEPGSEVPVVAGQDDLAAVVAGEHDAVAGFDSELAANVDGNSGLTLGSDLGRAEQLDGHDSLLSIESNTSNTNNTKENPTQVSGKKARAASHARPARPLNARARGDAQAVAAANRAGALAANSHEAQFAREKALFLGGSFDDAGAIPGKADSPDAPGKRSNLSPAAQRARRREGASRFGRKALATFMAVVLAVGLMPLPAFGDDGSIRGVSFNGDLIAGSVATTTTVDENGNVKTETTQTKVDDEGNVVSETTSSEDEGLDSAANARGQYYLGQATSLKSDGTIQDLAGVAREGDLSVAAGVAAAEAREAEAEQAAIDEAQAAFDAEDAAIDISGLDDGAFATQRVVVALKDGHSLQRRDGNNVVSGGNGMYVLQYKDVDSAKRAYARYTRYEGTEFAAADTAVEAAEGEDDGDGDPDLTQVADDAKDAEGAVAPEKDVPAPALGASEETEKSLEQDAEKRESEEAAKPESERAVVIAVIDTSVAADLADKWNAEHGTDVKLTRVSVIAGDGEQPGAETADEGYAETHGDRVLRAILESAAGTPSAIPSGAEGSPNLEIVSIEALDSTGYGAASTVHDALKQAAAARADVVNMSFAGYDVAGNAAIRAGVEAFQRSAADPDGDGDPADARDVALLAAAGNSNRDVRFFVPANMDGVAAVGALDGSKAPYDPADLQASRRADSNHGGGVALWAQADSTSLAAAKATGALAAMGPQALAADAWPADLQAALLADDAQAADRGGEEAESDSADHEGANVFFDASGGTGEVAAISAPDGTFTAPEGAFEMAGAQFRTWVAFLDDGGYLEVPAGTEVSGWRYLAEDGAEVDLVPCLQDGTLTLFAGWRQNVVGDAIDYASLVIDANVGGSVLGKAYEAIFGTGVTAGVWAQAGGGSTSYGSTSNPSNASDPRYGMTLTKVTSMTADSAVGSYVNYSYNGSAAFGGSAQTFTAPVSGMYMLQVWGAQGGSVNSDTGGAGGYSYGSVYLTAGETLYVICGESGKHTGTSAAGASFNGGGYVKNGQYYGYHGGGMTHISTINNPVNTSSSSWSRTNNSWAYLTTPWNPAGTLIVAGGGGGNDNANESGNNKYVGVGGGPRGGNGAGSGGTYSPSESYGGDQVTTRAEMNYQQGIGSGIYTSNNSALISSDHGSGGGGWIGGVMMNPTWSSSYANAGSGGGSGYVNGGAWYEQYFKTASTGKFSRTFTDASHVLTGYASLAGTQTFESPDTPTSAQIKGKSDSGAARITLLSKTETNPNVNVIYHDWDGDVIGYDLATYGQEFQARKASSFLTSSNGYVVPKTKNISGTDYTFFGWTTSSTDRRSVTYSVGWDEAAKFTPAENTVDLYPSSGDYHIAFTTNDSAITSEMPNSGGYHAGSYILPANTFTTPEGYDRDFVGWRVKYTDADGTYYSQLLYEGDTVRPKTGTESSDSGWVVARGANGTASQGSVEAVNWYASKNASGASANKVAVAEGVTVTLEAWYATYLDYYDWVTGSEGTRIATLSGSSTPARSYALPAGAGKSGEIALSATLITPKALGITRYRANDSTKPFVGWAYWNATDKWGSISPSIVTDWVEYSSGTTETSYSATAIPSSLYALLATQSLKLYPAYGNYEITFSIGSDDDGASYGAPQAGYADGVSGDQKIWWYSGISYTLPTNAGDDLWFEANPGWKFTGWKVVWSGGESALIEAGAELYPTGSGGDTAWHVGSASGAVIDWRDSSGTVVNTTASNTTNQRVTVEAQWEKLPFTIKAQAKTASADTATAEEQATDSSLETYSGAIVAARGIGAWPGGYGRCVLGARGGLVGARGGQLPQANAPRGGARPSPHAGTRAGASARARGHAGGRASIHYPAFHALRAESHSRARPYASCKARISLEPSKLNSLLDHCGYKVTQT